MREHPSVPAHVTIDLSAVTTAADLHAALRAGLDFPAWAGHTWDAVEDVVNRMIELPADVTFQGWSAAGAALPRDTLVLRRILDDYQSRHDGRAGYQTHFHYEG